MRALERNRREIDRSTSNRFLASTGEREKEEKCVLLHRHGCNLIDRSYTDVFTEEIIIDGVSVPVPFAIPSKDTDRSSYLFSSILTDMPSYSSTCGKRSGRLRPSFLLEMIPSMRASTVDTRTPLSLLCLSLVLA